MADDDDDDVRLFENRIFEIVRNGAAWMVRCGCVHAQYSNGLTGKNARSAELRDSFGKILLMKI